MNKVLLLIPAVLCTLVLPSFPLAEEASVLIEKLEQRMALEETVSGRFQQQKYIAVLPAPLESHGRFSYDHERGLVWETLAPIANRLEFNSRGIQQSVEGETVWEVDANQPAVVTITRVIGSVLAADWKSLQDYFQIDGEIAASAWHLRLTPRDEVLGEMVQAIEIRGDRVLSSMTLMETGGDRTEIRFQVDTSR